MITRKLGSQLALRSFTPPSPNDIYSLRQRRIGSVYPRSSILSQATFLTDPAALTWARTGARKSIFDGSAVAANTADSATYGGVPFVGAVDGATNLVDTDVTTWTKSSGMVITGTDEFSVFEGTVDQQHRINYEFGPATNGTCFVAEIKATGRPKVGLQALEVPTAYPTALIDLDQESGTESNGNLTAEWTDAGNGWRRVVGKHSGADAERYTVLANDGSYGYLGDGREAFQLRNVRAVAEPFAYPAFPDGSAAGASYGADELIFDASVLSPGPMTVVGIGVSYDWLTQFGAIAFERWFHLGSIPTAPRLEWSGTQWVLLGASGLPIASVATAWDTGINTFSYDHDGSTTAGGRIGDGSRSTATDGGPTFDTWGIGCQPGNARQIHGAVALVYFDRILTDAEYTQAREELLAAWGSRSFV